MAPGGTPYHIYFPVTCGLQIQLYQWCHTTVYAKTYCLMSKRKWYDSTYDSARARNYCTSLCNDLVHVRIIVLVLCPTWAEWTFSVFQWLVPRSTWSSSIPHHSHTLTLKYGHRLYLVFRSEILVTGLSQIQSYSQTQKIEKRTSKLNCHGETTEDADFLARTQVF